jgi:hypothetical protein
MKLVMVAAENRAFRAMSKSMIFLISGTTRAQIEGSVQVCQTLREKFPALSGEKLWKRVTIASEELIQAGDFVFYDHQVWLPVYRPSC